MLAARNAVSCAVSWSDREMVDRSQKAKRETERGIALSLIMYLLHAQALIETPETDKSTGVESRPGARSVVSLYYGGLKGEMS